MAVLTSPMFGLLLAAVAVYILVIKHGILKKVR